jgi:hypothetical protein
MRDRERDDMYVYICVCVCVYGCNQIAFGHTAPGCCNWFEECG